MDNNTFQISLQLVTLFGILGKYFNDYKNRQLNLLEKRNLELYITNEISHQVSKVLNNLHTNTQMTANNSERISEISNKICAKSDNCTAFTPITLEEDQKYGTASSGPQTP